MCICVPLWCARNLYNIITVFVVVLFVFCFVLFLGISGGWGGGLHSAVCSHLWVRYIYSAIEMTAIIIIIIIIIIIKTTREREVFE